MKHAASPIALRQAMAGFRAWRRRWGAQVRCGGGGNLAAPFRDRALVDEIGMTRFEPPQVSSSTRDHETGVQQGHGRVDGHRLPPIRGMGVRRVVSEDGGLDHPLP